MPTLTVVLPTYKEADNIAGLIREVGGVLRGVDHEILVVDDDSPDGTADVARRAGARVIVRTEERGLATAVVRGIAEARGDYVCVMDGDGQHPPEVVRRMIDRAVQEDADVVVGSRYVDGGSVGGFGAGRRMISGGASLLAKACLPPVRGHGISDPMSGLFLVRRATVDTALLRPTGYKILLEILGRCPVGKVVEVGYTFQNRRGGESKLGSTVIVQYLLHLLALGWAHPENQRFLRFGIVGLTGVVVNLGLLAILVELADLRPLLASVIAVETSILWNFTLNDRFTFHDRRHRGIWMRLLRFQAVSLLTLAVNLATFAVLHEALGLWYLLAAAVAIGVAFLANYVGNNEWTYGTTDHPPNWAAWLPFVLVVAGAGAMYLSDLDSIEGIYFDEEYYLSVAKQMENGVWEDPCWVNDPLNHRPLNFEHPPLAKLILAGSTKAFDTYHGVFDGCRNPESDDYKTWKAAMEAGGNPVAWRAPSAVMATLTVLAAGLAAGRLFGGPWPAFLAAGVVALDGLVLTQGRIAILDIFVTGFAALAIWSATFPTWRGVLGTAVFLGLAFASKYVAVFLGVPILLLMLWTHWRAGNLTRRRFDLIVATLPTIPVVIWIASYLPWWMEWIPEHGFAWSVKHFVQVTVTAITWGTVAQQTPHAYESAPWQWLLMERPMFYFWDQEVAGMPGMQRFVYTFGNPVAWWAATLGVLVVLGRGLVGGVWAEVRHRVSPWAWFTARGTAYQGLVFMALAFVGPLLVFSVLDRATFIFYLTLLAPLVGILLSGFAVLAWRRGPWGIAGVAAVMGLVVAAFVVYHPVWVGTPIPAERIDDIMHLVPWMRR